MNANETSKTGVGAFIDANPMWVGMMPMLGAFALTKAVCVMLGA